MSDLTFISRPLSLYDAQQFVDTHQAISAATGTNRSYKADLIRTQWQEPDFEIGKSSIGYFTDDRLVAYGVIWDTSETPVHPWVEFGVHPEYLDYDLHAKILRWADETTQRIIDKCPPDARLSLETGAIKGYEPAQIALENAGYSPIRSGYDMRIDMEAAPQKPTFPGGISIRTYRGEEDLHALVEAFIDAWKDHYGYVEEPFEKEYQDFKHWFDNDEHIIPSLIFLAIDDATDTIAGFIIGQKQEHGNPTVGHIDLVAVRPEFRRRGLAQAMLLHAFNAFWEMDKKSVTLGVDGESLTNAVKLYERVGMHILHQYERYEKLIRDGQELATVSIES